VRRTADLLITAKRVCLCSICGEVLPVLRNELFRWPAVVDDEEALELGEADGEPVCGFNLPLVWGESGRPEGFAFAEVARGEERGRGEAVDDVLDGGAGGGIEDD